MMDSVSNFRTLPLLLQSPRIKYPKKGATSPKCWDLGLVLRMSIKCFANNMELGVFSMQLHIMEEASQDIFEGQGVFVFAMVL